VANFIVSFKLYRLEPHGRTLERCKSSRGLIALPYRGTKSLANVRDHCRPAVQMTTLHAQNKKNRPGGMLLSRMVILCGRVGHLLTAAVMPSSFVALLSWSDKPRFTYVQGENPPLHAAIELCYRGSLTASFPSLLPWPRPGSCTSLETWRYLCA